MIDVLMTSVIRPEIIDRTLTSFRKFLFKGMGAQLRLIINVDPVGENPLQFSRTAMMAHVVEPFIQVDMNCPKEPSFPKAFKWVVEKSTSQYVFLLEDDWELLAPVDLHRMLHIMNCEPDLALLRLPMFSSVNGSMKNWSTFYPWNGRYFECPHEKRIEMGFCGHPSLVRGDFLRECTKHLDVTKNPEKQFHHGPVQLIAEVAKYRYGVFGEKDSPPLVKDIGREWLAKTKWRKKGNKAFFTVWEEE